MRFVSSGAVVQIGETLAMAAAGGAVFGLAGFPAGWLAGSMLFVAVAAIAGRPLHIPLAPARAFFVVIGITLGGVVTPETLSGMAHWPLSIALLTVAVVVATQASALYLRAVHGWDPLAALFASLPGALSQVLALASETDADLRAIMIVQTLRVVILTVLVPASLGLLGLVGTPLLRTASYDPAELALLVAASCAAAYLLHRVRFPGALIFGPMLISAVLHGSGLIHATLPWWLVNASAVGLGALTGSRFRGTAFRTILRLGGAALGSFAVAVAVTGVFAGLVIALFGVRVSDAVVAFAPGAVDAMMILALSLGLDPVYVGAHHVARVLVIGVSLPLLMRRYGHRRVGAADEAKPMPRPVGAED